MKQVSVDRFEGKFAICEDKEGKFFAIETSELPKDAAEGTVLKIDDDAGILTIDQEETDRRREKNRKLQNRVFNK